VNTQAAAAIDRDPPLRRFGVGDLEVDVGLQCVTRNGMEVPLPKLSFDLLVALAAAAPNYVTHHQLLEQVWPGIVVSDKTVSQRVKLLRDALADDSEQPRYIGSLRGRGYRLVAPVIPLGDERAAAVVNPAAPRVGLRFGIGLLGVFAAVVAFWYSQHAGQVAVEREGIAVVAAFEQGAAAEDVFLARGIAEGIHDRLSAASLPGLVGLDSSLRATGSSADSSALGERLGARYVLLTAVQESSGMLQLHSRLFDSVAGREVWSDTLNRPVSDLLIVEEYVASAASAALHPRDSQTDTQKP